MIGRTLFIYIFNRFTLSVAGVFMSCYMLVTIVDFLETLRKIGDVPSVKAYHAFILSATRVPFFAELILPFAVLIGSILCLVNLSRKLELVVARAAGISAWQFLTPAFASALLIGIFFTVVYNPIAVNLREFGQQLETNIVKGAAVSTNSAFWIRQQSDEGQSVMSAASGSNFGQNLSRVTIYKYDSKGQFFERIDSDSALLENGRWKLIKAVTTRLSGTPTTKDIDYLQTALSIDQVRDSFVAPDMVSYLNLRKYIDLTQKAGLSANRFELQFQVLSARPLLLIAMVMLAAVGSLKFFRLGGLTETIIAGVATGFLLYISSELANNLGRSGLINPIIAGWTPAVIGCIVGAKMLLTREDG
jgi:lipopolysaccharide export system permease protein